MPTDIGTRNAGSKNRASYKSLIKKGLRARGAPKSLRLNGLPDFP